MVVLDTSVIVDHLRSAGRKESSLMRLASRVPVEELAISVLTVQELYEGRSTREAKKEEALLATIAPLEILPYTYDTAELAGKIARERTQPIAFADAAIAATALVHQATLSTLDQKDFLHIPGLIVNVLESL